jgi:hypothetical protein
MHSKVHGLRAVKLTDIPLQRRLRAARLACQQGSHDGKESSEILAAALFPSDQTYWVRVQAVEELLAA